MVEGFRVQFEIFKNNIHGKLIQHITSKEKHDKINSMCFNIIVMAQVLTHG
jgi:hypothetical protein